jgi:hypothetical protein
LHRRAKQRDAAADAPEVTAADRIPSVEERMLRVVDPRRVHNEPVARTRPLRAAVAKRVAIGLSQGPVVCELDRDIRIWNAGEPQKTGRFLGVDFAEKEVEEPVHLSSPPKPDNVKPLSGRGGARATLDRQ